MTLTKFSPRITGESLFLAFLICPFSSCNLGCNLYADAVFNFPLRSQVNMSPRISQISPPVQSVQTEQPQVATTTLDGPETVSEFLLSRSNFTLTLVY